MRRILYTENDFGVFGGSARALVGMIRHLDRGRWEPWVVLARDTPNPIVPELESLGVPVVGLGRVRTLYEPLPAEAGRLARAVQRLGVLRGAAFKLVRDDLVRCVRLAPILRREGIDLLHANNNVLASRYAIWAAALAGVPAISHQRFFSRNTRLNRLTARRVRALLCISKAVHASVEDFVPAAKLRLVYDGVEVPAARPPRRPIGERARIALIGRVAWGKGQHVLIRAARKVLERFPKAHFEIIGGPLNDAGERYLEQLAELTLELGIGSSVHFVGFVRDVARRIEEELDVVVHTSVDAEPFGLVVGETMAMGKPVVASGAGGPAEIVEEGRSWLLFEQGNSDALADALIRILSDSELAEALAANGFERVRREFDVARTTRQVEEIYDEMLAGE